MSDLPAKDDQDGSSDLGFRTENIGKWKEKQENPFAEQNRKAAEEKKKRDAAHAKTMPYVKGGLIALGCMLSIALVVVAIILFTRPKPLPEDITPGSVGAAEITDDAQKVFDNFVNKIGNVAIGVNGEPKLSDEEMQKALEAVSDYFEQQNNRIEDESKKINLVIVEMQFYARKGQPSAVLRAAEGYDVGMMTDTQALQFLGLLMDAAFGVGDVDLANEYVTLFDSYSQDEEEREEYP